MISKRKNYTATYTLDNERKEKMHFSTSNPDQSKPSLKADALNELKVRGIDLKRISNLDVES